MAREQTQWQWRWLRLGIVTSLLLIATNWHSATATPGTPAPLAQATTVTYPATTALFANPERGFYHYVETRSSDPLLYDLDTLQAYRNNENITLLYCIHYLDTFVNTPISAAFLQHIQTNLATVRAAGLKCILRFAYTDDWNNETPPFGDATKTTILAHIAQLEPILRSHSAVIAAVQAGFIGVWGEWYYSDHFVDDPTIPWVVSPAHHADRFAVLQRLLNALPTTHAIQVRYPHGKQAMFGTSTPLDQSQAYSGSALERTGYHNDCFLASATDFGTYREEQLTADKAYLAAESAFLPIGGETCNPNPPRSQCPTALQELARFHWSYLNREYHPAVYASWVAGGCSDQIARQLGYRLVLQSGLFPNALKPGDAFNFQLTLQNQGFAAPFNPRGVELILRAVANGAIYRVALPDDPRRWWAGATLTLHFTAGIPTAIPQGNYELLLHLPAPEIVLRARPEYAIRLANADVWEATTGYNRLNHTLAINNSAVGVPYNGSVVFRASPTPVAPTLTAVQEGATLVLDWTGDQANQSYEVHRSTTPFFTPTTATLQAVLPAGSRRYADQTASADSALHYFYQVRAATLAANANPLFADSNEVGEIVYPLNNAGGKYSLLALPFPAPTLINAATLASSISNVTAVLKWNPATQAFRFFAPPGSGDNFALGQGDVIFVVVNSSGPNKVTMTGHVTALQQNLTPGGFNFVSLPLQKANLTNAASVAADITNVQAILSWNESTQLFRFFTPPTSGDNFGVQSGQPFVVRLATGGPALWPAATQ